MKLNHIKGLSSDRSDYARAMAHALAASSKYGSKPPYKDCSDRSDFIKAWGKLAANSIYPPHYICGFDPYNKETADKITETGKKVLRSSIKALNDWINEGHSIREIAFPELLDELLIYSRNYIFSINYKPTKMKQFKNRFAVTGDIIQLLSFERELIKLGYTLGAGSIGKKDVFNYRSVSIQPARFITVGIHTSFPPGTYIPASNDGSASAVYDLSSQFKEALKVASELIPLLITEDGVPKSIDDKAWCVKGVKKELTHYYIKDGLDEKSPWLGCKYFDTEKAALDYIKSVTPLFITQDGVPKFLGNTVWYIRPNWVYHFWRTGIKESYANSKGYIYFDKEENLIKYIKENRPVIYFSKAEMEKFITELTGTKTVVNIEYPKDFVKRD